jgi:hypothetical protein
VGSRAGLDVVQKIKFLESARHQARFPGHPARNLVPTPTELSLDYIA